ncbi:MAG TPA: NAD-dependent succinate-semialdehyde dehydrogenase [Gemmatimonadaceae bacterium]|nr:NAD-dependent succinate-semialdehyde dehydrogenase [Gemmatimonadaceae bacterium]
MMKSINPATGETLDEFDELTDSELDACLERAARAFAHNRLAPFAERARRMSRAAEILDSEKNDLGKLMTLEMGKPLRSAADEAAKCAWVCRHYAEHAHELLADEDVRTEAARSYIAYQPLGAVLAVMPWNFPFWQVFRFAAPALMAGNVAVLKHASNVPQCALAISDVLRRAGFDGDEFQTLLIASSRVGDVIRDPRIAAVTITGSEQAGREVASTAGKVIKKTVLELGGSDPFIVMPSADLDKAAQVAVKARMVNNGESCIAAKRFIVHERIAAEFEQRFVAGMSALTVGDPMDPKTDVGPLATPKIRDDVATQVERSVAAGARVAMGGRRVDGPGNYYAPTVLTDIPRDAPAYHEEVFGPVASLFRVASARDAITLANDTTFGLGASVWTRDDAERDLFIRDVQSGAVFVNAQVVSDPRLPFGGVKRSGYGRELSREGIREFVNVKTILIAE